MKENQTETYFNEARENEVHNNFEISKPVSNSSNSGIQNHNDFEISDPVFISSNSEMWYTCCQEGGNE
jgi:hypothetical protein